MVDVRKDEWEQVDERVEVHSGHESNDVYQNNHSLPMKQGAWDYGVVLVLPFPDNEGGNQDKANNQLNQDICTSPRLGVSACLESSETTEKVRTEIDNGEYQICLTQE